MTIDCASLGWIRFALSVLAACVLCGAPEKATAQEAALAADAQRAVHQTFNATPFRYEMKHVAHQAGYSVYRLTYPSPVATAVEANNTVPADYYLPDGAEGGPRRPAVIVLHILNGNYELERMLCASLASRGIPALMFKLPYYGERSASGGRNTLHDNPALLAEALPQGIADCRRTIDVLAARPEVDPQRIGAAGISLGGIVAATAAGSDARLYRTALLLSGGDLLTIIHHCREARALSQQLQRLATDERAKLEAALASVDPLRHAAQLKPRAAEGRVLMVNASEDDVIPPECTRKLAAALGIGNKVVWLEGLGHYTAIAALPQTLSRTVDFFAQDLPESCRPAAVARGPADAPAHSLAAIVKQVAESVTSAPAAGRCHLMDLTAKVTDKSGKTYEGRLRLIRGAGNRFLISGKAAEIGEVALGYDDRPWLASTQGLFRGRPADTATAESGPLGYADPKNVAKLKTLAEGISGLLLVPGLLDQVLEVHGDSEPGGARAIVATMKEKKQNTLRFVLDADGRPASASFSVDGARGTINFHVWQANTVAPDELFSPPAGKTAREVSAADLNRIFSATFDFLMEITE